MKIHIIVLPLLASLFLVFLLSPSRSALAATSCTSTPTDKGTLTATLNVTTAGTYRVWSRIRAASGGNDSYILKIDGQCYIVGDSGLTANTWSWINYENGSTGSIISVNLTAGSHSLTMAGREANVGLDRLLFLTDTSCTPSGTGDNCAVNVDNQPPTVSISSPTNGATVSSSLSISATASDDIAVSKVQFYADNVSLGTDSSAPYSIVWNSASVSNGSHVLKATASDAVGNNTSATVSVNVANSVVVGSARMLVEPATRDTDVGQHYTIVASVDSGTNPINSVQLRLTYDPTVLHYNSTDTASSAFNTAAPASNGSNWVEVVRGSTTSLTGKKEIARFDFDVLNKKGTTALTFNATYSYALLAGNKLTMSYTNGSYRVLDLTAPSAPTGLKVVSATKDGVSLSWSASSDNVAVTSYTLQRNGSNIATGLSARTYIDTNVNAGSTYSYRVKALDAEGNSSAYSNVVSASIQSKVGDFNNDGSVNVFDLSILLSNWGTTNRNTDLNSDGTVNVFDFSIFLSKWGT